MPQVLWSEFISGIAAGSLGSFPTDTVPALAVRPDRADRLFHAKQRPPDKPLILLAGDISDVWQFVKGTAAERQIWQQTADRYWPGALTLVLPASDRVPEAMNPHNPTTIGVRVPQHPIAQAILRQTAPLATTSANRSGQPALQTLSAIEAAFPDVLTLFPTELEAVAPSQTRTETLVLASGLPSTVIRWTGTDWETLRQGAIVVQVED